MLLLFFAAWIIFNGRLTVEIVLFGVAVAALVFAFMCKFMDYSLEKERAFYRKLPLFCKYVVLLIKEIIKANLAVCKMILSRKEVMLANSITLTPGTITVSLADQELLVHCLDKSLAEGMEDSDFVRMLENLEGEVH